MGEKIEAPFSAEQVIALNRFQNYGFVHEFTCPTSHKEGRALVATKRGWICPHCDYTQNWAHSSMLKELENPFDLLKRPTVSGGGEWRDISTAPKDGTRILACDGQIIEVIFWAGKDGWFNQSAEMSTWRAFPPNLWMPLPAAPSRG